MAPLSPELAKRSLRTSRFVFAVLVFLSASLLVCASGAWAVAADKFPYLSWTAWTIKDLLGRKQAPDVVFLGSSLMLVPLDGVDADHVGHRLDGSQHHHSIYVEEQLQKQLGSAVSTFNFALPGEMPSDAYLIGDYLLKDRLKPRVIVYGVGPRDFLDNMLPSPSSTDPFRFLSRFGDVAPLAGRLFPGWEERLNFELGQLVYFYGKRIDLSTAANNWVAAQLSGLLPLPAGAQAKTRDERHALVPDYMPTELHKGDAFFRPSTAEEKSKFSAANLDEYRRRYKKLKPETFKGQLGFFRDLLSVARSRGILVVVVAMPITDLNRSLLSDENWNLYRHTVSSTAAEFGASLLDLSESAVFTRADFLDTVHLHAGGGKKLLDLVTHDLSASATVRQALALPPNQPDLAQSKGGRAL